MQQQQEQRAFAFAFAVDEADEADGAASPAVVSAPPAAIPPRHEPPSSPLELELVALDAAASPSPGASAATLGLQCVEAGVYEGGASVWEATAFLLAFLAARPRLLRRRGDLGDTDGERSRGGRVADLGCGAALLACACLRDGGVASLLATDLNAHVLRDVAAPALRSALSELERREWALDVTLVAGTWDALLRGAEGRAQGAAGEALAAARGCVDLLLSSETLYRPQQLPALVALIAALLRPPRLQPLPQTVNGCVIVGGGDNDCGGERGGLALLATKRYYYGAELGGGTAALLAAAAAHGGLQCLVVASREDGRSMMLDIIVVRRSQ